MHVSILRLSGNGLHQCVNAGLGVSSKHKDVRQQNMEIMNFVSGKKCPYSTLYYNYKKYSATVCLYV